MNIKKKKQIQRERIQREEAYSKISFTEMVNKISIPDVKSIKPVSDKPIMGFWHICMINNYHDIIKEQLELLIQSCLYDASEYIFVGCSGKLEEFKKVETLFGEYTKIKIFFNPIIDNYEFPTLEYLKNIADIEKSFFAFYFHTKAVSQPTSEGGKHWRDYMNYYNITRWKDNTDKLKQGYDTCGVKLIMPGNFPLHYSGNFWWANSEYIKKLKKIDTLNRKDRYEAEMWICSNQPSAASLCQTFVDYGTRGKFIIPHTRTIVHTLGYNLPWEIEKTTNLLYEQNERKNFEHVIVDLGFPLSEPNAIPSDIDSTKLLNSKENITIAYRYDSQFISIKNRGVSQNWEMVRQQMKISDQDVLICADPDERPKNNGWVKAISDVLIHGPKIGWCSLMMKEHLPFMPKKTTVINGHNVYIIEGSVNWAQGGFSGKFLNDIGGVPVPTGAPIYGWIEDACMKKMKPLGYKVAVLADYFVEHTECSPLYREWKTDVTSNVKNGQIDFEEWLRKKVKHG